MWLSGPVSVCPLRFVPGCPGLLTASLWSHWVQVKSLILVCFSDGCQHGWTPLAGLPTPSATPVMSHTLVCSFQLGWASGVRWSLSPRLMTLCARAVVFTQGVSSRTRLEESSRLHVTNRTHVYRVECLVEMSKTTVQSRDRLTAWLHGPLASHPLSISHVFCCFFPSPLLHLLQDRGRLSTCEYS